MGRVVIDFISLISGLLSIASAFGLLVKPTAAEDLGVSRPTLLILFTGSLIIMLLTRAYSFYNKTNVKTQAQIGGRNNSQNMN